MCHMRSSFAFFVQCGLRLSAREFEGLFCLCCNRPRVTFAVMGCRHCSVCCFVFLRFPYISGRSDSMILKRPSRDPKLFYRFARCLFGPFLIRHVQARICLHCATCVFAACLSCGSEPLRGVPPVYYRRPRSLCEGILFLQIFLMCSCFTMFAYRGFVTFSVLGGINAASLVKRRGVVSASPKVVVHSIEARIQLAKRKPAR